MVVINDKIVAVDVLTILKQLKRNVDEAKIKRKVFTMIPRRKYVEEILCGRGWMEKIYPSTIQQFHSKYQPLFKMTLGSVCAFLRNTDYNPITIKKIIQTKLLGSYEPDFVWVRRFSIYPLLNTFKNPYINKLKTVSDSNFSQKPGVVDAFNAEIPNLLIPRCYNLKTELALFWNDFHLTALLSLLKYIIEIYKTKSSKIVSPSGKIPLKVLDFVFEFCEKFIDFKTGGKEEDFKNLFDEVPVKQWDMFHYNYFKIIHYGNHFLEAGSKYTEEYIFVQGTLMLTKLSYVWPDLDVDGWNNIWILKPFRNYGGHGIELCQTRMQINKILSKEEFIAQKYIERPLLIYDTKFDVRQWVIITNTKPFTIWISKWFYLRFSRETFSLRKLHRKVHLTNTCVQDQYYSDFIQDPALPDSRLWSSEQFDKYLNDIGYPNTIENILRPRIKQAVIGYLNFHKKSFEITRNCFEILGADFLLTEDFEPWLLEINQSPAMEDEKFFFRKPINRLLNDVVEVVLNNGRFNTKRASSLELIYQEKLVF